MNAGHTWTVSGRVAAANKHAKRHIVKTGIIVKNCAFAGIQWRTVADHLSLARGWSGRGSRALAGWRIWEGTQGVASNGAAALVRSGFSSSVRSVNDQPRPLRQWPATDRLRICSQTSWSISRRTRTCLRNIKVKNESGLAARRLTVAEHPRDSCLHYYIVSLCTEQKPFTLWHI